MTSVWLNYIDSFWLFRKCIKTLYCIVNVLFLYEKTHRYLKNDSNFFDALKTKDRKIRGNCNSLIKVKFHKLERRSPLKLKQFWSQHYRHSLVPPLAPITMLHFCSRHVSTSNQTWRGKEELVYRLYGQDFSMANVSNFTTCISLNNNLALVDMLLLI